MNVFDTAKAWLSQSVNLLSTDAAALNAFIEALKKHIAVARDTSKQFDKSVPKHERWQSRIDNQHRLHVLVPALRLAYCLRQGGKRSMQGYELASFLLACVTKSSRKALYAAPAKYIADPVWPALSRSLAAGLIHDHPALFAPLPAVLARADRGLVSAQADLNRVELFQQKQKLRDRILTEMTLNADETALLRRFLS